MTKPTVRFESAFRYNEGLAYRDRSGQAVELLDEIKDQPGNGFGRMWKVRFSDGAVIDAFHDELYLEGAEGAAVDAH